MATFGERLKCLRKEKQLTVEELASKLGSAKSTISRYENNLRDPKKDFLEILSNFFDVSVDYLLGRTEERSSSTKLDEGVKTIAAYRINPNIDLPDDAIEKINDFIRMVELDYKNKDK